MVKKYYEAKNALALVVNILPRPPPPRNFVLMCALHDL